MKPTSTSPKPTTSKSPTLKAASRESKPVAKPTPRSNPAAAATDAKPGLLTIDEALALLKTTRPTFYRWLRAGQIKGMKVGRQWRFEKSDIERFLQGDKPRIEVGGDLGPLFDQLNTAFTQLQLPVPTAPQVASQDAANAIIHLAMSYRASDIHLEPFDSQAAILRFRLDGALRTMATFDLRLLPGILQSLKSMATCDINQKQLPQSGRIRLRINEVQLDIRVSFLPSSLGECVTMRLLSSRGITLDLDKLPFSPKDRERIEQALKAPSGTILCTGPTGSGKTTTLYGCLRKLINPAVKIISLEDPVEYLIPGITQVQMNYGIGLTFPAAMRAMLRNDPDVIMVAETRDQETLMISIQASLTGHLVLTSMHTQDSAGALRRMIDLGGEPYLIADTTRLVISQRLIRRLCPHCAKPSTPPVATLEAAGRMAQAGGISWESLERKFREPVGCPKCRLTGYQGRVTAVETLRMSPAIAKALIRGADVDEIRTIAVGQGMTTFAADAVRQAAAGEVLLEEAVAIGSDVF